MDSPTPAAHVGVALSAQLDLWRELLAFAHQTAELSEEALLHRAVTLLLTRFQAGHAEIRLAGPLPGLSASMGLDGVVAVRALPAGQDETPDRSLPGLPAPETGFSPRRASATASPPHPVSSPTHLAAPLQSGAMLLGSLFLAEPKAEKVFTTEQQAWFPLVAEYLALLLEDRRTHQQLRTLALAEERSRLARELHDSVAQSLSALILHLDTIEEPHSEVLAARTLAHRAQEDARRAIWGLRPALLEALPLHEALAREVERMADEGHLSSHMTVVGEPRALLPHQEMALFRIAQEALSNTMLHAAARRVRALLTYSGERVRLTLEDDGRGFDPARLGALQTTTTQAPWLPYLTESAAVTPGTLPGHLGLQNMAERARLAGGWLEVESTPGQGTRVLVTLPVLPDGEHEASAAQRIRVLIVDDHALTRAGIRRLLEAEPDFEVVGEAADGLQALAEAQDLGPQVILMDARMPGMNGLEALRQLRASNPDLRVLMLSAYEQDEDVFEALQAGASGYVLKDMAPQELARSVRVVARGETLLAPGLTGKLVDRFGKLARGEEITPSLTARESEVLRCLASGLRNKEIARQLGISERTVTFHLEHIYQKLQVSSRTEALSRALERGWLKP